MSDHPHDSSLSPKLGSWPLSDSSHVDHQKAAKYIPQIGNVDSVQYARLHGLFEPLLLEPYKILRHHQRRSYWDVDLLNDDHLPGFLIPHCVVSDDQSFESDGYASHVIRGDITPVDSDSVTTFMHTVIERNIKLALPLLRSDNDRDLAEFFAMRRCYQHFDIKEFVLPLEPVDETHDEGMEFPESAVHLLCLLESEAEFETLESLDLADEWLQSSLADIKETLSYDDVFMTRHAPAVRLLSPPLSPVQKVFEPFVPSEEAAKLFSPDSDIPSLIEFDLAAAIEGMNKSCPQDDIGDEALETALTSLLPQLSSPYQTANAQSIKIDLPLLKLDSILPPRTATPCVIDLTQDEVLATQLTYGEDSLDWRNSQVNKDIVIEGALWEIFESKAEAVNASLDQERLRYRETALRMTAPVMDFTCPVPLWALLCGNAKETFLHITKVFPGIFNFSIFQREPNSSINRLPWKLLPSFPKKWAVVEDIDSHQELLATHLSLDPIAHDDIWDSTNRFTFLNTDAEEDELQPVSNQVCPPKAIIHSSRTKPPEPHITKSTLRYASQFFPSSDSLTEALDAPLKRHTSLVDSQRLPKLSTPNPSSPARRQKSPTRFTMAPPQKRHSNLLADVMAIKRLRSTQQKNQLPSPSIPLPNLSNDSSAGQHLANFMNIMSISKRNPPKSSPFFSSQTPRIRQITTHSNAPSSVSKAALAATPHVAPSLPPTMNRLTGRYFVSVSIGTKLTRLIQKLQPNIELLDRNYSRFNALNKTHTSLQPRNITSELCFEADISISSVSGILIVSISMITRQKAEVHQRVQKVSRLYKNLQLLILANDKEGHGAPVLEPDEVEAYTDLCCFSPSLPNNVSISLVGGVDENVAKWVVYLLGSRQHETLQVSPLLSIEESSWERLFRLCGLNVCAAQVLVATLERQWQDKGLVAFAQMTTEQKVKHFSEIFSADPSSLQRISTALSRRWR